MSVSSAFINKIFSNDKFLLINFSAYKIGEVTLKTIRFIQIDGKVSIFCGTGDE